MYEPAEQVIATFRTRKGAENAAARHGEVTWDKTRTVSDERGHRSLVVEGRFTTYLRVEERREAGRTLFDTVSTHLRLLVEVVEGQVTYEDPARKALVGA